MRTARPLALSEDGKSLIVETDDGEQIAILADANLRQMLRDRPRPQLEIEMDSGMTPREIQTKIRAGASVEEIAEISGMPESRVEAFAAPVLAERDHIAGLARLGSVRRAGEPTGHRTLRSALTEKLRERGVDPDSVRWDAFKMDDGRWSVSAGYRLEQAEREAVFYFDHRGRFSVAGNDEARWAIGERVAEADAVPAGSAVGSDADSEPTLKLAGSVDEMALLRSVETDEHETVVEPEQEPAVAAEDSPADDSADDSDAAGQAADEPAVPADSDPAVTELEQEPSQLDLLYDLLGSDGYAEDSIRVYEGLSDASAVPDVADDAWEPATGEDYPAEADEPSDQPSDQQSEPAPEPEPEPLPEPEPEPMDRQPEAEERLAPSATVTADGATQEPLPGAVPPASAEPAAAAEPEPEPEEAAKPKSKKRKRASVPSWDEIMFGSPKSK
jgi:hypothetical protein